MLAFARMLVLRRVWMVHMRIVSVAVKQLRVEMDAPGLADVSIGVHMHVQAAELHGQEAHARGDRNRVSQMAHGKIVSPHPASGGAGASNTCRATGQDDAEDCHHQRIGGYEDAHGNQLGPENFRPQFGTNRIDAGQ
ncbi:MAG: hypothetical protein F4181_15850 [Proteobacteria bacterium]|nr:hypothetical protein [Pseudomonadota bacterium]